MPGFGGGVIGLAGIARQPDYRRYVDDAPVTLAHHQRNGKAGRQESSPQVHRQHFIPVGSAHPHQEAVAVDAGVVDQDVQPPQAVGSSLNDGFGGGFVGYIAGDAQGFAAVFPNPVNYGVGGVGSGAVVDGYGGAGGGQADGNHGADAARRAGYQRYLSAQVNGVHTASILIRPLCCAGDLLLWIRGRRIPQLR